MRLELFGKKSLVSSIALEENQLGLHLLINQKNRNCWAFMRGGSIYFQEVSKHYCIVVAEEDDSNKKSEAIESECEIVIIAENQEDEELLKQFPFDSQTKDQVSIQFIDKKFFEHKRSIFTWVETPAVNKAKLA